MKYLIVILFSLYSCKQTTSGKKCFKSISVIRDVTDTHLLIPDANSILQLYTLSENRNVAVAFRYREISDRILMPVVELSLPDISITEKQNRKNEPLFREKAIVNFYDTIRRTLNHAGINNDSSELSHSECFKTISDELNFLAQSNSSNKVLIVYSNLFENSAILSVYKAKTPVINDPQKVYELFEKSDPLLQNLNDIKVYFVFQPSTREEDFQYLQMAGVYKRLLEARGAIVRIKANNDFQN